MNNTASLIFDQIDAEHYAEWLEWRKGIEFYHEDEWDSLIQRDDMFLDSEYSYTVFCNTIEDFISFAVRLDDTSVLEMSGTIVTVWQVDEDDDDDDEEEDSIMEKHFVFDDLWDSSVPQMYNMEYNPCMTPDKRIYVTKSKHKKRSKESIILNPQLDVTFPSVFLYGRGMVSGKVGQQIRGCCHFIPVDAKMVGVVNMLIGSD